MVGDLAPALEVVAYLFANLGTDAATLETLAATYEVEIEVLEPYVEDAVDNEFLREIGDGYELTDRGAEAATLRGGGVSDRMIDLAVDEIRA